LDDLAPEDAEIVPLQVSTPKSRSLLLRHTCPSSNVCKCLI